MAAKYPIVLNGTSIEELQAGDTIIGVSQTYDTFTATASQTTFTTSVSYTSGNIQVFANGVLMVNGSDVTVTSGTQVVFATGLASGTNVAITYMPA
jgi:hypothetical protein